MIEHFVTIFDGRFLPQGLALRRSLTRSVGSSKLWVVCVDDLAHDALSRLDLPNVTTLKLANIETPELRAIRPSRTFIEYCWTLTPWAPRFVFEADSSVERVTYIDADLWFRRRPDAIFRELEQSGKAVLITDHAFAPEHDHSDISGQYCVQFMSFVRGACEPVRSWWEARCLEWCHARAEGGLFGDQKYLDDWPDRFPSLVHVLEDQELTLAPWNLTRFPFGRSVFHHFHGLRLVSRTAVNLGNYAIPRPAMRGLYRPYLADLNDAITELERVGIPFQAQASAPRIWSRPTSALRLLRRAIRSALRQSDSGKVVPLRSGTD